MAYVEKGGYNLRGWDSLLGNNHLYLRDTRYLTDVVLATMRIANGADIHEVIAESTCKEALRHAFKNALKGG